jgi:hypothetical protein
VQRRRGQQMPVPGRRRADGKRHGQQPRPGRKPCVKVHDRFEPHRGVDIDAFEAEHEHQGPHQQEEGVVSVDGPGGQRQGGHPHRDTTPQRDNHDHHDGRLAGCIPQGHHWDATSPGATPGASAPAKVNKTSPSAPPRVREPQLPPTPRHRRGTWRRSTAGWWRSTAISTASTSWVGPQPSTPRTRRTIISATVRATTRSSLPDPHLPRPEASP